MKTIKKINQYLLKNYPLIWNTRLVWMLSASLFVHLLFFIAGFYALSNPESLQKSRVIDDFLESGSVLFGVIISILLLVSWLIYMFKNNAFKSYYPTSNLKLFAQFCIYILIIFVSSTFYYSYNFGLKTYISTTYTEQRIEKEVEIANAVAPFFSQSVDEYELDDRAFPLVLQDLHCETSKSEINYNKPFYYSPLEKTYQFYTVNKHEYNSYHYNTLDSIRSLSSYISSERKNDSIKIIYLKDSVKNISNLLKNKQLIPKSDIESSISYYLDNTDLVQMVKPSYYNYSKVFFRNDVTEYRYNNNFDNDFDSNINEKDSIHNAFLQSHFQLLERNNTEEFNQLFTQFLAQSKVYNINTNLTAKKWLELVKTPNFELNNLIKSRKESESNYYNSTNYKTDNVEPPVSKEATESEEYIAKNTFIKEHITPYYYTSESLYNVYDNITEIKNSRIINESFHFFLWFAFALACLLIMFRTTATKPLIFSVLTVIILSIFISLCTLLYSFIFGYNFVLKGEYFALFLIFIISTSILLLPFVFISKTKKLVSAVCINISIIGFPLYVLLIIGIISVIQKEYCEFKYAIYTERENCPTIFIEYFGLAWSPIIFVLGIIFMFFYVRMIKKWKSLPES